MKMTIVVVVVVVVEVVRSAMTSKSVVMGLNQFFSRIIDFLSERLLFIEPAASPLLVSMRASAPTPFAAVAGGSGSARVPVAGFVNAGGGGGGVELLLREFTRATSTIRMQLLGRMHKRMSSPVCMRVT